MAVPALIAALVGAAALGIFWRLTKTAGTNAAEMNCVLSFGSKKGGFELAQELKHTMAEQFSWPSDSIYMDCDAMEDKPGTVKELVLDENGAQHYGDDDGTPMMNAVAGGRQHRAHGGGDKHLEGPRVADDPPLVMSRDPIAYNMPS